MKRIFLSAFAILLATAAVQAQADTTKGPRREHRMLPEGRLQQLNLSADQQAKLKTMRDEFKQKRDALEAQKLTADEHKTQMQALHQQQKTAMEAILTPAQREQLAKMRTEGKAGMEKKKAGNDKSSLLQRGRDDFNLLKELNLTTEQQAKMKEIRTGFRTKAETLRNDTTLTRSQRHNKLQDLMLQQHEQINTLLTKEQQEKLQLLRKERAATRNTK